MRWYLPNIARFPSVDPLTAKYPELTPYQFASNTPIVAIDIDGLESDVDFNGVPPTEEPMSLTVQEQLDIINKNYIKQPSHFSFKSIEVTYNAIPENAQEYISIHEYDANNPTHYTQGKYKYRDYQLTIYLTQVKINGIVTSKSVSFTYDLDEFTDGSCVDTNDEAGQSALAWGTACLNEESVVALPSPMMKKYGLWPGDFGIIEYQGKTSFPYIGDNS